MTVLMEVSSWRSPPEVLGSNPVPKKRAWGPDAQQLMQLMMNQLQHSPSETSELTLDLLGNADPAGAASSPSSQRRLSPDILHLDSMDTLPLPSGWEKCLDLQTGETYYVNKSLGVSSFNDPRKRQRIGWSDFYNHNCRQQPGKTELQMPVQTTAAAAVVLQQPPQPREEPPQVAHEFLASKQSESESLNFKGGQSGAAVTPAGCSTSSSSGSPPLRRRNGSRIRTVSLPSSSSKQQQLQHQQQKQHQQQPQCWSSQQQQHHINYTSTTFTTSTSRVAVPVAEDSHLELDLNLFTGGGVRRRRSSSPPRILSPRQTAVCTVEMIQNALRSSEKTVAGGKREAVVAPHRLGSSSFSSLTTSTTRSEPSASSPTASNSSSASSRSGAALKMPASAGLCQAQSIQVERVMEPPADLVMGACTRCLMYVMLQKADPRCPRCDSQVPLDFAPQCKKQSSAGLKLGLKDAPHPTRKIN